ncbi:MAG: hypothetical protein J5598_00645 [Clostridia bacterium]|nr:hypothetical protein [Clostridia bacterium]
MDNWIRKHIADGKVYTVYSGTDNGCRCGCKGKYYKRGDRSFHRIFNEATKLLYAGCEYELIGNAINIPRGNNKTYTLFVEV